VRSGLLIALVGAVGLGCSKPAPPTLTPQRATLAQITPLGLDLSVELSAMNPNASDLAAQSVTAHVVVDNRIDLGTLTLPQAVTLPAGKATALDVPLSVKWNDLAALAQLGAENRSVPFSVDGTLKMGGTLLDLTVPFHIDGTATHEQIVRAAMSSLPGLTR
jgi:hypothetical protein